MKATTLSLSAQALSAPVVVSGDYFRLVESFQRSLKARGCSPRTVRSYIDTAQRFGQWLVTSREQPTLNVNSITPGDIREWEEWLYGRPGRHGGQAKPSAVNFSHRSLQAFFKWLAEEEELAVNPMLKVKAPELKEVRSLVIVTAEQWVKLLKGAEGKDFTSRRDMAILRLFLDTPVRLAELAGLKLDDIDFGNGCIKVLGKGGRFRTCHIGAKTEATIDRYLRVRAQHSQAAAPWLWLGKRGRMTPSGVYQMIKDRAAEAGFPALHPHEFRATFAANWLREGGTEQALMRIAGWSSRAMIQRYTTLAADELAAEEYKRRRAPGDRL